MTLPPSPARRGASGRRSGPAQPQHRRVRRVLARIDALRLRVLRLDRLRRRRLREVFQRRLQVHGGALGRGVERGALHSRHGGRADRRLAAFLWARQPRQPPQRRFVAWLILCQHVLRLDLRERLPLAHSPPPNFSARETPFRSASELETPLKAADLRTASAMRNAVKQEHETVVSRSKDSNRASSSRICPARRAA